MPEQFRSVEQLTTLHVY